MRIISVIILVIILSTILVTGGCTGETGNGSVPENDVSGPPAPGKQAPDFKLPNLDGDTVSLSGLKGEYIMLNFWATWCGPCRAEMPFIQEVFLDPAWTDRGFEILAVNLGESPEEARGFLEKYGLTFTVLLDERNEVGFRYNISAIPTTYFIDSDGIIKSIKIGTFRSKAEIEQRLQDLITD